MDIQKLKDLAVNESGLIFEPSTGYIFTSNTTGILIINSLKDGKDTSEIKKIVVDTYDINEDIAEKDIFDFISNLANCGLIKV
ncbi:MAG: PqqD family protein [Deltaproteobacteria bacterium]|nr:PqqD family protein [Deltaproteobacteria bacterium]